MSKKTEALAVIVAALDGTDPARRTNPDGSITVDRTDDTTRSDLSLALDDLADRTLAQNAVRAVVNALPLVLSAHAVALGHPMTDTRRVDVAETLRGIIRTHAEAEAGQ